MHFDQWGCGRRDAIYFVAPESKKPISKAFWRAAHSAFRAGSFFLASDYKNHNFANSSL
ncbi:MULTISPECIES: hypothetical protein [Pseudomonas]|uniref:hypothetical protein n=1 Tax=Pseudomonas TaxID=286 RepID=UPI0015BDE0D3|nr:MULTISPECIES: hypothetical protein [Pseudomonas]